MQSICQAKDTLVKLWGVGKIQKKPYRLIDYGITAEVAQGLLVLNTVTGELIFLDAEEAAYLSKLPCDHLPWMNELIQKHFLVPTDFDEQKSVASMRSALKILKFSPNIIGYMVLPTTACNARCFYCYEAGIEPRHMADETADQLVDFMDAHRGGKKVSITWFGGEPLVGMHQIDRICQNLKKKGIPFVSSMLSNGYLFDAEIVKRAKDEWHLEQIQITLDGTEKIYNETKAYVNPCESPYYRVLDNIGYLLSNEIDVEIRLNLGLHNADDLSDLVDEIAVRFQDKTHLIVYAHLLFDGCGDVPIHFTSDEVKSLLNTQKSLYKKLRQHASVPYRLPLPHLSAIHCRMDTSSVVVFPDGKLGKCQHYAARHFVGDLEYGVSDLKEVELLRERNYTPECAHCPKYPACIKLKYCEIDNTCNPLVFQYEMDEIIHAMHLYYEDFLKEEEAIRASKTEYIHI